MRCLSAPVNAPFSWPNSSASMSVGGIAAVYDYLYDANGRLLKVLKDNVPVEEYAYDENGTRVFEMNTLRGIPNRSYQYSDEDHPPVSG